MVIWGRGGSRFEDGAALFVVGSRHQDRLVPEAVGAVEEFLEGRVGLDEVVCRQRHAQLLGEVLDALRLVLAAAVGEEDEGDVVLVQELQDLGGAGNRPGDVQQDAVDARRCQQAGRPLGGRKGKERLTQTQTQKKAAPGPRLQHEYRS